MLKAFYYCNSTGENVISSNAIAIDRESALGIAQSMLHESKDFVGFVDANGTTLQFIIEDSGLVWMEVPAPEEDGSYGKTVSRSAAESVIGSLPEEFSKDCIPGLEYQAW